MTTINLSLPDWMAAQLLDLPLHIPSILEQMALVIHLSQLNFEYDTGGPFAAGVFEVESGRMVSLGVNRVVPLHCSSAHAEVMALSLAQHHLATFDLGGPGLPDHRLVVNWRPCTMCFGAVLWSGVRELVIAGSGPELESLTDFDEGPIHPEWRAELHKRGIHFTEGVRREEAVAVFRAFGASNRLVYNARRGTGRITGG
jgi:tRNA(Arg) A34 adenosine deaminase TadA